MSSNSHGLWFSIFLAHVQISFFRFFCPVTYLWICMDDQSESQIHCKSCDRLSNDMVRTRICMDFFSAWLWWFWYDLVTKSIVFLTRIHIRKKSDKREQGYILNSTSVIDRDLQMDQHVIQANTIELCTAWKSEEKYISSFFFFFFPSLLSIKDSRWSWSNPTSSK